MQHIRRNALATMTFTVLLAGCSSAYYGTMEKFGFEKREIMVDRVEDARDAQDEASEQFANALEQFRSVVSFDGGDLEDLYDDLNDEYERSQSRAQAVSERIGEVESVAGALFEEWEEELNLYKSADLRRLSKQKLQTTKARYHKMIASMHRAEKSMTPVLRTFRDNVLFLKHNLNAQAIGSLRTEFSTLKGKIDGLIKNMNEAIQTSNKFIADIKQ